MAEERIGERVLIEPCLREADGQELDRPWFFGSECDGAFAEYTTVAARHAYPIESALSDIELASFPCSYATAENLLTRSNTQAGDRVLVTGASGGVGSAAVQLARARGARVIAFHATGRTIAPSTIASMARILNRPFTGLPFLVVPTSGTTVPLIARRLTPPSQFAGQGSY